MPFQELCRDLFFEEPEIGTCDIYGVSGQAQAGIDLLAPRKDGAGAEVGQCKCCEDFPPAEIRAASDKFFGYWDDRWSKEDIKRFILFVACDLNTRQQQDEVRRQVRRFAAVGIVYEAWSAATLRNKLRPHRGIVATYCPPAEYWVVAICGEAPPVALTTAGQPGRRSVVDVALAGQLEQLAARMSGEAECRLDTIRAAWHEGRTGDALRWLAEFRNDPTTWQVLSDEVKAKFLRFTAGVELNTTGNIDRARQLAEEAAALAPAEADARVQAIIAHRTGDSATALQLLEGREEADSLNLRCALLLELNRVSECRTLLEHPTLHASSDADTHRLRALAALASREVDQARLAIQKALELQPRWESIRYASAMIDYFAALSPAVVPTELVAWPAPVDWDMVKRDDESLSGLRGAARAFRELADRPGQPRQARQLLQAWALACMANDPERQADATGYCRELLEADRTDFRAIAWGAARRLEVDLAPSEAALRTLVSKGQASLPHILALVTCYIAARAMRKAINLLKKTRPTFEQQGEDVLWMAWNIRSIALNGSPQRARSELDQTGSQPDLRMVRAAVLQMLANQTGDWQPLIDCLESSYEETREPLFLLDLCQAKALRGEWDYVADRADQLVARVATGPAVGLAAVSAYNARRFDLCLRLLDDHRGLFSQRSLPAQLRRLRASCQRALGLLPEAIAEAEALTREEPTGVHLLTLAQLHFDIGDLKSAALAVRRLRGRLDITPTQLLRAAHFVYIEDQNLAKDLWRQAVGQDLGDEAVALAVDLAVRLGLDQEVGKLFGRVAELSQQGRGGLQLLTIDDVARIVKQQQAEWARVEGLYLNGTIPIHFLAERAQWTLADLYHRLPKTNAAAPDPSRQAALLIRHGGRGLTAGFPDTAPLGRLHLDVTAVLLGAHLNILGAVERAFRRLRIPATLIPALGRMRERLEHHQPSRLPLWRQIVDLAATGELTIEQPRLPPEYENAGLVDELGEDWVALFEEARARGGYLVDFLPLQKRDRTGSPTLLLDGASDSLVTCRAVVEALRQHGPLSDEAYAEALASLGDQGQGEVSGPVPPAGALLFFHANTVEVLAEAGILLDVCRRFGVVVEQSEVERARASLRDHEERQATAAWLAGVIDQLRQGVTTHMYQVMPEAGERQPATDGEPHSPEFQCLLDLLSFQPEPGDLIWCDDRYVTSFLHQGSASIVGVNEILQWLVAAGAITRSDYYAKLMAMRAGNARFIPIQADEILYHLRQARLADGKVVETRELTALRRYSASCLLPGTVLQRPPRPEGSLNWEGEVAFPLGFSRAVIDAIVALWETSDPDAAESRVEWLLANLHVDHLFLRDLLASIQLEHADPHLVATGMNALLIAGMGLPWLTAEGPVPTRRRYLDWVYRRLLGRRFEAEPRLIVAVADMLKQLLSSLYEDGDKWRELSEYQKTAVAAYIQAYLKELPAPVRAELEHDTDFMAHLGLPLFDAVEIAGVSFLEAGFWRAASEAINGREARLRPLDADQDVTFRPVPGSEGGGHFYLDDPGAGALRVVADARLELLRESPIAREESLRRHRDWFDCSRLALDRVVAEVASMGEPARRMRIAEEWRRASAAIYYANLTRYVRDNDELRLEALRPPSVEGLLRHCRFRADSGVGDAFLAMVAAAAGELVEDEGVEAALERLGGLPLPLADAIVAPMWALSPADRRSLFKRLLASARSPVAVMHVLALLRQFQQDAPAYGRLARHLTSHFLRAEGQVALSAFTAVLTWVYETFGYWEEMRAQSPQIRLALTWLHAHRLFTAFVCAGATAEQISEFFGQSDGRFPHELFDLRRPPWFDIAHPRQVNRAALLLSGIAYGIRGGPTGTLEPSLRDQFYPEVFDQVEGQPFQNLALLRDTSLMRNDLGSFLGDDRSSQVAAVIGPAEAATFTPATLHAAADKAIASLAENSENPQAWLVLHAVLGDLPPYPDLIEPLATILRRVEFARLTARQPSLGFFAIQWAARQSTHAGGEELRRYLQDELVTIARNLSEQEVDGALGSSAPQNAKASVSSLLTAALDMSQAVRPENDVAAVFVDIVSRLLEAWPAMASPCRLAAQWLADGLPIRQSRHIWCLIIQLRALGDDAG